MKGYAEILTGWVLMLVIFIIVNSYLTIRLESDVFISDTIADSYRMINAIEFAKLNAKQDLEFSIEKTKQELKIDKVADKEKFLNRLKTNFRPSHDYSEVDVSVSLNSLKIEDSKAITNITFTASSEFRKAQSTVFITQQLE